MIPNNIKDITNFIFIGKDFKELTHYDLLIINADYAEEQVACDIKKMYDQNIIDDKTEFIICAGHGKDENDSAQILCNFLKEKGLSNKIIIDDKYISNPLLLKNINKLVDINKYNRILRIAKDFVARRFYMNAKRHNFPIEKCDFYGVVDGRGISKDSWYLNDEGKKQVLKELVNIGTLYLEGELDL